MSVAEYFELEREKAKAIATRVGKASRHGGTKPHVTASGTPKSIAMTSALTSNNRSENDCHYIVNLSNESLRSLCADLAQINKKLMSTRA